MSRLEFKFKHAIYTFWYDQGEINFTKYIPAVSIIIKSDKTLKQMKKCDHIRKHNNDHYAMHYDGKIKLGKVISFNSITEHHYEIPFEGFPYWFNIFKCKNIKNRFNFILYTENTNLWIPLHPARLINYIKQRHKNIKEISNSKFISNLRHLHKNKKERKEYL